MILILRIIAFILGVLIVFFTLLSAIRTLVLPRAMQDRITGLTFSIVRWIFGLHLR